MSNNTDSNKYTILFAIGMVVVVGSLLAFTASSLKPNIVENERMEKQQNILYAMGVNENGATDIVFVGTDKVADEFSKYIAKQLIVDASGNAVENNEAYLIDVKKEQAKAKNGQKRDLPLFVGQKAGQTYYIAPIRGKGLWDAIWGYVAMDENMVIQGAYFDHKGETPGLGANIKQRYFMDDFNGEKLLTASGEFKGITVAKGNNDPKNLIKDDYEVDALAGATITGDGVSAMIKSDLKLYLPFFKNLKNQYN
ncbi:Na(+)-translocating NADH-quinone reductase subunit C [Flavobacteriaceae bacterium]|jgi:Na+-transporting NADH:ubiquinone oxidoreductase subunit C|uniref:Na(+)-translocating NADH-quinone reductase subunit C n=1 Tax=Formosa sp. Hel3_A1_48 TaxID=1336795 RepID=UPI00084E2946|nr:Na(+)-translocating NADH-quinone reductase subunit C [Formosa sp. Hel3_A1_48]MDA9760911.1 Na(+)-translocating NADH-quinone reductase subunit C [Flavobacteriaceae bacterium]MDA9847138.1 Na(+)-translocating NADH-quinone reductase subunit C [Flavobacteriaceae bacterium]MDC0371315.1 Na(+)-translocating NADH-quinone reductase subunit C [Flavobacteriaceae bacterium]MDG1673233.1 Na(+)-translocating NADH-quinone reductase subunit C [Flavobacteriaceae bacterium]MDG2484428.1 Na(+)-translocating NADH-|tara:strand:- start:428 stop:1186 length:759 start_codon:yes stop_codon:yes gene_type:complete